LTLTRNKRIIVYALKGHLLVARRNSVMKGTVKWFDPKKGYGFITKEEGGDVFVHWSALEMDGFKTLKDGQEVEFEIQEGPKGPQAAHVKVLS